jgi:hypothetical protein
VNRFEAMKNFFDADADIDATVTRKAPLYSLRSSLFASRSATSESEATPMTVIPDERLNRQGYWRTLREVGSSFFSCGLKEQPKIRVECLPVSLPLTREQTNSGVGGGLKFLDSPRDDRPRSEWPNVINFNISNMEKGNGKTFENPAPT